ncbi:MAG: Cna B-type domain-containing protein [Oscillospiraceae bacterium]|nr:Cna B-type domain-containing protein [Oscillospiraceae bacterium]
MSESLLKRIIRNHETQNRWIALVLCLSMLVSLGTFATLHKTAVAQTYTKEVLDCPYTAEGAEPVAHTHNDDCRDESGSLVCTLPEREAHVHAEDCYTETLTLICGKEESAGHQHSDACYTEHAVNLCGQEESIGHQHSDACYTEYTVNTCGLEENPGHQHSDACYETRRDLICGMNEGDGAHTHSDACFVTERELTCGMEEGEGAHTHSDNCYEVTRELTCSKEVLPLHVHDTNCIKTVELTKEEVEEKPQATEDPASDDENDVPEKPESDPEADLETEDDWARLFEAVDLTGNWAEDLITVAETQLGYSESSLNFEAYLNDDQDGYKLFGWTRYGAWYGYPYGDWCAMFISFCLHYAGISEEDFPYDSGTINWADHLAQLEMYHDSYGYLPKAGDLVFFDWEGDHRADHVGIVYEVDEENNTIRTIEGNRTNSVEIFTYNLDYGYFMGYGILPENPDYEPIEEVAETGKSAESEDTDAEDPEGGETADAEQTEEDGADTEEAEPGIPMPAQSFELTAGGIQVSVEADEGAFPENTRMSVTPVNGNMLKNTVADAINAEVLEVQAVDIKFYSAEGEEIEPLIPIRVSIIPVRSQHEENKAKVVHIDKSGEAELIGQAEDAQTENEREVVFDADSFSIYAIVYAVDIYFRSYTGETFKISMSYNEDAGIPEDAELAVTEILEENEDYGDLLAQTEGMVDEKKQIRYVRFFDISILSGGEEVQPAAPVSVKIELAELPQETENTDGQVIHFGTEPEMLDASMDGEEISFEAESFSVYALVYTVDFEYEVDGQMYCFSLPGGEKNALSDLIEALGILGDTYSGEKAAFDSVEEFLKEVANVEFSDESLVKVTQNEEDNDWTLESLQPFSTEESLTITMKNGDVVTVKVTDAQEIEDAEKNTIDPNKSYLICYEVKGVYYLLKNDGTVDSAYHPNFEGDTDSEHDFEHLNSTYAWTFSHIFKEQDVEEHLDKNYYLIRPIDNKSRTITLNNADEALVQQGNNNVAVIQTDGGFILEGYHNVGTADAPRYIHLGFDGSTFAGVDGDGVTVHIYEMDSLPTYDYTVRSDDEIRGTVTVSGGTLQNVIDNGIVVAHYYDATSTTDKKNAGTITATPVNHRDTSGRNKWEFDHWELNGLPLDREQYPATIQVETLPIPHNGSNLVAYFRQNPEYVVPNNEKEPSSVEDMTDWLEGLQSRNIPLDNSATTKTAEVYDYQNRIYGVDFTSKANFETFAGNLDMAFCLDVSNSMYFPSALVETTTSDYDGGNTNIPIYQINSSGSWGSNKNWLDTSRGWNNPYYLIADASGTATVFKIYYQGGNWKAQDASRTTESDKSFVIGEDFKTNWTATQYNDGSNRNHPFTAGDNDNTTYTIYDAGDNGNNRFVYLNQSLSGSSTDLNTISGLLAVAGDASPGVRIAYNTFNKDLGTAAGSRQDFQPASSGLTVNLNYAAGGGTRPDQAFNDAQSFSWSADYTVENGELTATDRYVILVTDGAPQGVREGESSSVDIDGAVRTAAKNLKNNSHVKMITVGLSMENVTSGKQLLYDLADFDSKGNKMFYMAESGSDLQNIFRQITKVLMEDTVVLGDITDTVGEGFYLVNKATGLPLAPGDTIDIEGNLTTDETKVAGVVQDDGRTVVWTNQSIDSVAGWHGTVYVKAQEELLGGNAMNTNDGEATIVAKKYRVGGKDVEFDTTLVRDTLNLTAELPSPKVNVNELTFFNNETEWTVYLGTEVDPKQQLKALYDSLEVEEVVNKDRSLHFSINPNSIEERWNDASGTAQTFSLPGLIETLIRQDTEKAARYFNGSELNWDVFLEDILGDGILLPYHEFGLTDGSNIRITLEKTIVAGEEQDLINRSPHATTVTGDAVEKYTLRVAYEPDYTVTPVGQGGQSTEDFHTGTFGSMYQAHATGRESSTNEHVINVYNVPLDVYKVDDSNHPLSGATFKLYREDADNGVAVAGLDSTKKYVEVATATSGADGVARLKHDGKDFGLVLGEKYYLIETQAPANYTKVSTVWEVEVQTEIGKFTDLDGEVLYSTITPDPSATPPVVVGNGVTSDMYPFNWDQGARIMLDGKDPVLVIAKGEEEGTTVQITNGSFVSHKKVISFRHTVLNLIGGKVNLTVNKEWEDNNDPNRPASVEVTLYRVSEKDHVWGEGVVVPSTCTAEGVKEYTCSVCGEKDTHVISAAGHTPGTSHREHEVVATCTTPGSYDTVVRCTVCNAIISSEHTDVEALGHVEGEAADEVLREYVEGHCYDTVVRCTRCGEVLSSVSHDHTWGEWQVTTPAQPGVAGEETRTCDHGHVQTQEIPALPNEHTVTITFYYVNNQGTQGTYITQRSGTGAGDMTIQWNWDQWTTPKTITIDGLGTSTFTSTSNNNNLGALQTLKIQNITTDLTLNLLIWNGGWSGTSNELIYQPMFVGNQNSTGSTSRSLMHAPSARSLLGTDPEPQGSETTETDPVKAYLNGISGKDDASCKNGENHIYKELVGTYTISGPDWSQNLPDLPQYNEYGKPYTYYVVETPVDGYETSYTGQDNGTTGGAVEIKNTLKTVELTVNKTWAFETPSRVTSIGDWPQGAEVHVVVYSKIGDNDPTATTNEVDLTADLQTYTFTGLPMYDTDGVTEIVYSIVEAGVTGVDGSIFTTDITGDAEDGYTITNTEKPNTKEFSFTKIWRVAVGEARLPWPAGQSITVTIKQNSAKYATYTIEDTDLTVGTEISAQNDTAGEKSKLVVTAADAATGYVFSLTGLPYGDTEPGYTYTVSEETVSEYQSPKYFVGAERQYGAEQIGDGGTICNDQIGYTLPATGGPGTRLFTILGSILILGAGALLWRRRRLV